MGLSRFRYLAADENVLYGATVTNTAGTVDTSHQAAWLCDGRGRPCKWQNGTAGASAVGATARQIDVVVLHGHNLDAGLDITISGGGGLSETGDAPPARRSGIPTNPAILIETPVSTTTVQFGVASNSVAVIVAEMLAGPLRESLNALGRDGTNWGYLDGGRVRRQARFGTVPDLDLEQLQRYLRAELLCETAAEADAIVQWFEGSRNETRPSVILPFGDTDVNDAWVVSFARKPSFTPFQAGWKAALEFEEWPRTRW